MENQSCPDFSFDSHTLIQIFDWFRFFVAQPVLLEFLVLKTLSRQKHGYFSSVFERLIPPTNPAIVLGKRLIPHVSYIEYAWLRARWWVWAVVSLPTNQPMVGEAKLERKTAVPRAHLLETELLECVYLEDMESKLHKTAVKAWSQAQQLPEDIC